MTCHFYAEKEPEFFANILLINFFQINHEISSFGP